MRRQQFVVETHHALEAGDSLVIEAGETHEIRADAGTALETVSVYAPPDY